MAVSALSNTSCAIQEEKNNFGLFLIERKSEGDADMILYLLLNQIMNFDFRSMYRISNRV